MLDYGWSGLWPVYKFGPNLGPADLTALPADANLLPIFAQAIRNNAPPQYRTRFPMAGTEEREEAIANLRRITDDVVDAAVADVPTTYMTQPARDLTAAWLRGRLARVDTLVNAVFPQ